VSACPGGSLARIRGATSLRSPIQLVIHDDTADKLGGARRGKEHFTVGTPALLGRMDPKSVETARQRGDGLVGRQDSFSVRDHRLCDALQVVARHWHSSLCSSLFVCLVILRAHRPLMTRWRSTMRGLTWRPPWYAC